MARKGRRSSGDDAPHEILMPPEQLEAAAAPASGHRSARNDPSMRDGDSAHGNPDESVGEDDEVTTDNDVGDTAESGPPYGGPTGGAVGGALAEGRAKGGRTHRGLSPGGDTGADRTLGT
jgi:hypothetical protein